jgi:hypothetical protein
MLQIDPVQFIIQAVALAAWVCLAAAIYSAVEKLFDSGSGPANP